MPALNPSPSKLLCQLTFEGSWPPAVAFLGSGRRLAAGNQLGQLFVWDLPETPPALDKNASKERQAPNVFPVRQLVGHQNEITRLLVTPERKQLVLPRLHPNIHLRPPGP